MYHSPINHGNHGREKQLFEAKQVRTVWDEHSENWWFSVLDIITILTDQADYKKVLNYWKWLKSKLNAEGSEVVSITNQLKLKAPDGKMRLTDVIDTEQVFRIIQTSPSKKAELFKLWFAEVAKERLDVDEFITKITVSGSFS